MKDVAGPMESSSALGHSAETQCMVRVMLLLYLAKVALVYILDGRNVTLGDILEILPFEIQ